HYLEYTEGTDIQILIENTMFGRNKLCSDPRELRSVLKKIDHPRLGATLDIINLLGVEEEKQKKRYKKIKDWVRHIHINSLPVYEGDFKMKKFVKYLLKELKFKKQLKNKKEEKYNIPVILEGKTSLAREMQFYNDLSRKLK
ncbi:MAG: TIM barrel protein, partial [Candidatus Thermoplasmatota archaeon]|nr:TIM barrel protein [Candidatus Thermoplasmatota archaeon]